MHVCYCFYMPFQTIQPHKTKDNLVPRCYASRKWSVKTRLIMQLKLMHSIRLLIKTTNTWFFMFDGDEQKLYERKGRNVMIVYCVHNVQYSIYRIFHKWGQQLTMDCTIYTLISIEFNWIVRNDEKKNFLIFCSYHPNTRYRYRLMYKMFVASYRIDFSVIWVWYDAYTIYINNMIFEWPNTWGAKIYLENWKSRQA